jgi:hypothetical protein
LAPAAPALHGKHECASGGERAATRTHMFIQVAAKRLPGGAEQHPVTA